MKITISESIRNKKHSRERMSCKNFLSRLDITNKRIRDPEVGSIEIIQTETKRKKKEERMEKQK